MKKLILLLSIFFMTACSAEYRLTIDKSMKVKESLWIKEYTSVLKANKIDADKYVQDKIELYDKTDLRLPKYNKFNDFSTVGIKEVNKYSSVEELVENSVIMKKYNVSYNKRKEGKYTHFIMIINGEFNQYFSGATGPLSMKNISLVIDFPYPVKSSNADRKNGSLFTWSLDYSGDMKRIEITYLEEKPNNVKTYGIIALVLIGTAVIVYLSNRIYKRRLS